MAHIHFTLQGKGGVGKTTCTFYLTQHLIDSGKSVSAFDCDPVNWSLSSYKSIKPSRIDLKATSGNKIDPQKLPILFARVDEICKQGVIDGITNEGGNPESVDLNNISPEDMKKYTDHIHIIFDVGASGFLPVSDFLNMGALKAFEMMGNTVYLHCIIAGDKMLLDCILCLETLLKLFPSSDTKIMLWKNEFFGPLAYESDEEQFKRNHYVLDPESPTYLPLEKMDVFKNNESRFIGIITVKKYDDDLVQSYVSRILRGSLTFRNILQDKDNPSNFNLCEKMFVMKIRDQIYDQLCSVRI